MIKANELRIGNIIASSGNPLDKDTWVIGKVHSISSLDSDFEQIEVETDEAFTWFFKDNYFGIPLTEEWLLKFGFKKGIKYYSFNGLDVDSKGWIGFNNMVADCKIKHVHQLQNLYFALIGEELSL